MLRVRKPMPKLLHGILGVVAILGLVVVYTGLAETRQQAKRSGLQDDVAEVEAAIQEQRSLASTDTSPAVQSKLARLEDQKQRLMDEAATAVDRTVPTWQSLYRDGWLRVVTPQGLRKNEHWLWDDNWATMERLFTGLSVGVSLSVLLGVLMGGYAPLEALLLPPLSFLAKIPPTAMLAVFFVLVGTSFNMYVTMIAFGILPTLAQSVYQAAKKDVPDALVDKAYTLGANQWELLWNVIYKQILPRVIDAVRLQIGPAMVVLVAAEWMVADEGYGYRLRLFYQRTDMTVVYLYCFLLGAIGLIADYCLIALRRWLCPWFGD